jgi:hypothetical protein
MSEDLRISKGDENASVSKEWDEGGLHYCTRVEKVEGGYIVTESKNGYREDDSEKKEYVSESTRRVTTENPLSDMEDKGLFSFIKDIFVD